MCECNKLRKCLCFYLLCGSISRHGLHWRVFADATSSSTEGNNPKTSNRLQMMHLCIILYPQTALFYYCDAAECTSHRWATTKAYYVFHFLDLSPSHCHQVSKYHATSAKFQQTAVSLVLTHDIFMIMGMNFILNDGKHAWPHYSKVSPNHDTPSNVLQHWDDLSMLVSCAHSAPYIVFLDNSTFVS